MPMLRARISRANTVSLIALLAMGATLSGCGADPKPANNAAAVPDANAVENVANVTSNAAVVNEVTPGPAPVENTAASPEAKPVAEAAEPKPAPVAVVAVSAPAAPAAAAGDAASGAKAFAQCRVCHSVEPGKNGLGPSLHDVVGRKAGTLAGFNYSPAMKASGFAWSDAKLNDYLRAPMKAVPGTKMAFAGIADDKRRADVIAYLDTLK